MAKKKDNLEDDGRVIANMNIEGMPWYEKDKAKKKPKPEYVKLSSGARRAAIFGGLAAGAVVLLVFAIGYGLLFVILHFMY